MTASFGRTYSTLYGNWLWPSKYFLLFRASDSKQQVNILWSYICHNHQRFLPLSYNTRIKYLQFNPYIGKAKQCLYERAEYCSGGILHQSGFTCENDYSFLSNKDETECPQSRTTSVIFFYLVLSFILLLFIYIFFIYYYRGLHLLLSTKLKKPHHCTIAGLLQQVGQVGSLSQSCNNLLVFLANQRCGCCCCRRAFRGSAVIMSELRIKDDGSLRHLRSETVV